MKLVKTIGNAQNAKMKQRKTCKAEVLLGTRRTENAAMGMEKRTVFQKRGEPDEPRLDENIDLLTSRLR